MRDEGDAVAIGATTRQCVLERDPVVAARLPLLAKALPLRRPCADRGRAAPSAARSPMPIRPPRSRWSPSRSARRCAIATAPRAREIAAADFFVGPMMTALPPAGCLTAVRFPVWREPRIGSRLPRGQRAPQRLRVRGRGRAGRPRRGRRLPPRCRSASARSTAVPLRLDAVARGARRHAPRGGRGARRGRRGARRHRADVRSARVGRLSPARRRRSWPCAPSRTPLGRAGGGACALSSTSTARPDTVEVEPRTDACSTACASKLLLTGAHAGCEHGVCGACTVLLNGLPVRSCLMFVGQAEGGVTRIETVESLADGDELHPLQASFRREPGAPVRLLHAGDAAHGTGSSSSAIRSRPREEVRPRDLGQPLSLHRLHGNRRLDRARRRAHARPQPAGDCAMSRAGLPFRVDRPARARGSALRRRQGPLRRRHRAAGHPSCRRW